MRSSSMVTSRSKSVACFPWCSTFNSSLLRQISLGDEKNSVLSFITHRSSMNNLDVSWYL